MKSRDLAAALADQRDHVDVGARCCARSCRAACSCRRRSRRRCRRAGLAAGEQRVDRAHPDAERPRRRARFSGSGGWPSTGYSFAARRAGRRRRVGWPRPSSTRPEELRRRPPSVRPRPCGDDFARRADAARARRAASAAPRRCWNPTTSALTGCSRSRIADFAELADPACRAASLGPPGRPLL